MVLEGLGGILLLLEHCTRGESRALGSKGGDLLQKAAEHLLTPGRHLHIVPHLWNGRTGVSRDLVHTAGSWGSIHLTEGLSSSHQAARNSRPRTRQS